MIYLTVIILLFLFAIFDLYVGVSNDAVNFLNSAIGSKAAKFKIVLLIAAIGVFAGAVMSNGMMDVARHGIFHPQYFTYNELICIMLGMMTTDVVLLDVFNTLGMPTSTTISLVFELLGGSVALAIYKTANDPNMNFSELLNTEHALTMIIAIFISVAIAFVVGMLVQYLCRLVFSFNYKKRLKYFIGIFGGLAVTTMVYFMLIKNIKGSALMTPESTQWITDNSSHILLGCFVVATILMQILNAFKVSVLRIVVLLGTFALAMAFASNDLVNFIGVPLAGFSAYQDFMANAHGAAGDSYLMNTRRKEELSNIFQSSNKLNGLKLIKELGLEESLDIKINKMVKFSDSPLGIWAQIDFSDKYVFSKKELDTIKDVRKICKYGIIDNTILYRYGLYSSIIAGDILDINRSYISSLYKDLPIYNDKDIVINGNDIINILKMNPCQKVKDIMYDIENSILDGSLSNDYESIKKFILKNWK